MISATRSTEICCSIGRICSLADCARVSDDRNDRTTELRDRLDATQAQLAMARESEDRARAQAHAA
jgi:hypothetical protein